MQGKELSDPGAGQPVYVGVDVCKARLDVYLHPVGRRLSVANGRDGLRRVKRVLGGHRVALVVLEATGRYHRMAHRSLAAAGFAVAVVNPLRARLFAEASGALAKTDRLDARLLALLAAGLDPPARPPAPEPLEQLDELVRARAAASAEATALANRLGASQTGFLKAELRRRLASTKRHIDRLQAEIARRIAADASLARRTAILVSIPGIGPVAAATLVVGLAELGSCSAKAAASLAGLAPVARDSGTANQPRRIRGGRTQPRAALYMAALAATRHNPDLAAFYKRLRNNGKKPKLAITAVMRKLVVLANTLLTQNRTWTPTPP